MSQMTLEEAVAASERGLATLFEDGARLYAQLLWQHASRRQRRKYPSFGMTESAFRKRYRTYQNSVIESDALPLEEVIERIENAIPVYKVDPVDELCVRIAGENLQSVSMFLCCLGEPACRGDLEFTLQTTWDIDYPLEERRFIRSYEGRSTLLLFLNRLLAQASTEISKLAQRRGTGLLRYYYSADDDTFMLDHEVLETNYLALCSLLRLVETEQGHA